MTPTIGTILGALAIVIVGGAALVVYCAVVAGARSDREE
jgi:hypothetical protein